MMKRNMLAGAVLAVLARPVMATDPMTPTQMLSTGTNTWTATYDAATYGSTGTITFNDWGYVGPSGVGVNDYEVGAGFDAGNLGQTQHVITKAPDLLTSDAYQGVVTDLYGSPAYPNGSMDGQTQFYKWGYTTPMNSTFSNMLIDREGNYKIARDDMSFGLYDKFDYTTATTPTSTVDTNINFKPYTVSDAMGWCGSTLVTNPNGLSVMAGQVTFDIAFDVYFDTNPGSADGTKGVFSSTQLIPGMVMRSYGDYIVDVTQGSDRQYYTGSAVGNNMNPTSIVNGVGGTLDEDYLNQVSFLGAGVIPKGVWVSADSFNADGSKKMRTDNNPTTGTSESVWDVRIVEAGTAGAVWHNNSFGGFAFLMRADGTRTLEWISPEGHSIYELTVPEAYTSIGMVAPVPVPAAAWLFGSGLLGLLGIARKRRDH